jgi:hypothetical protein
MCQGLKHLLSDEDFSLASESAEADVLAAQTVWNVLSGLACARPAEPRSPDHPTGARRCASARRARLSASGQHQTLVCAPFIADHSLIFEAEAGRRASIAV